MSYTIEQLQNCVETATRDLRREISRLEQELADAHKELIVHARLAIQRRAALERLYEAATDTRSQSTDEYADACSAAAEVLYGK